MQHNATTLGFHLRNQTARKPHGGHDMEIPIKLPFFIRSIHDGFIRTGASIIDENIGTTSLSRSRNYGICTFHGRHIGCNAHSIDAIFFGNAQRFCFHTFFAASNQHKVRAFCSQSLSNSQTNPDRRTGDDGRLSLQFQIHINSCDTAARLPILR